MNISVLTTEKLHLRKYSTNLLNDVNDWAQLSLICILTVSWIRSWFYLGVTWKKSYFSKIIGFKLWILYFSTDHWIFLDFIASVCLDCLIVCLWLQIRIENLLQSQKIRQKLFTPKLKNCNKVQANKSDFLKDNGFCSPWTVFQENIPEEKRMFS